MSNVRDFSTFDSEIATQLFFTANVEMLCVFDIDGPIRLANPSWLIATGWTIEQLTGRAILEFLHPGDVPDMRSAALNWAQNAKADAATLRFLRPDGGYRWLEWRGFAPMPAGPIYATVRDVTDDRRQAIHGNEIEARTGVGSWEMDLETHSLFWSPTTYAIHEVEPGFYEPKLNDGLSFYPPEAQTEITGFLERLLSTGQSYDAELPFVTAKGRHIWVRATAAAEFRNGRVSRAFGTFEDVTAERSRREHFSRLSAVAERTTNAVMICSARRRIEWVNAAFERMTGYSCSEALGHSPATLLQHEGTDPAVIHAVRAALDAGQGIECELHNRTKTGELFWIKHDIQPVRDAAGELTGFISVATDITDQKRAEARLVEAERDARHAHERLESAINALPDSFLLFDADERLVICNEKFRDFYPGGCPEIVAGATFEEILRYGLNLHQYPDAVGREERWLAERLLAFRNPGPVIDLKAAGGRWFRMVETATPDGGRVALRTDITELKEGKRRLGEILRGTNVGTWEWNVQTGQTVFNERWAEIIGFTLAELAPISIDTWLSSAHPDDLKRSGEALDRHFNGVDPFYECEARMRHRDGHWVWALDRGRVATWTADGKPEWMFGTHQDITERKQIEEALNAAREKAEQATATKSAFLATMTHEIRTPLNGVLGMAAVVEGLASDPEQKRMIATIRESGKHLLAIVNDILDISKIEAGMLRIETIPFQPSDIARRIDANHASMAAAKGLDFTVMTTRGADAPRMGDPMRILQILDNLVSNAIKFTLSGEVAVAVKCAVQGSLTVEVRDTGIGMSEAQTATLFNAFTQGDGSTTRRYGGTGLGMSIVRHLVDTMGGEIRVFSRLCEGTRVEVILPIPFAAEPALSIVPKGIEARMPRKGLRILAADDVATNRLVLEAMLKTFGAQVSMTSGGREAVDAVRAEGPFDVLLLDISMPDLDGCGTLSAIREAEDAAGLPHAPAAAVTANAMRHQIDDYIKAGFARHIAKPLDIDALSQCLCELGGGEPQAA